MGDIGRPELLAGRYRVLGPVGRGAIAEVLRARDEHANRHVALKIIYPHLRESAAVVERFRREVEVVRRIAHPHVLEILDLVESDGLLFWSPIAGGLTMIAVSGLLALLIATGRNRGRRACALFSLREQIVSAPVGDGLLSETAAAAGKVRAPELRELLGDLGVELYRLTRRAEQLGATSEGDFVRRTVAAAPRLIDRLHRLAAHLDALDGALEGANEGELMQALASWIAPPTPPARIETRWPPPGASCWRRSIAGTRPSKTGPGSPPRSARCWGACAASTATPVRSRPWRSARPAPSRPPLKSWRRS